MFQVFQIRIQFGYCIVLEKKKFFEGGLGSGGELIIVVADVGEVQRQEGFYFV